MRVISLFSGAGGLALGLTRAGMETVWANDFDRDAVATYRRNIGGHIVLGDIADVRAQDIPDADILAGGIPCQGFSRANVNKVHDDERNFLFLQFARVLRVKRPKYFLVENVRGLVSFQGGEFFATIIREFESAGYRVRYTVLNAADYGVPQNRIRVFIVGVRADVPSVHDFNFPARTHSRTPVGDLLPWETVGEALKGIPEPAEAQGIANHVASKYKVTDRDFTGHRRTDPNKPSPTILARGDGGGGVCAIQHPKNHRRMSVRETAIIQTFPLDFVFCGKLGSCYRQVGNAVPVLLAQRMGEAFASAQLGRAICV